jgi:hypothetical protein
MDLKQVLVQPVHQSEEKCYQDLMQEYHYPGSLPKISEIIWYIATWLNEWMALFSISAAAFWI